MRKRFRWDEKYPIYETVDDNYGSKYSILVDIPDDEIKKYFEAEKIFWQFQDKLEQLADSTYTERNKISKEGGDEKLYYLRTK